LHEHGVLVIPDFIAYPGGVICTAMEYPGKIPVASEVFKVIGDKMRRNPSGGGKN
jgi:glutamate dehydrogenase/leucine dehydrogenase